MGRAENAEAAEGEGWQGWGLVGVVVVPGFGGGAFGVAGSEDLLEDLPVRRHAGRGGRGREELRREISDDAGRHILSGHDGLLSLGRDQRGGRDLVGAADLPLRKPSPQPRLTAAPECLRSLIAGQEDQRAATVGVVERPLSAGK